jgi:outer membrane protein OmpA-like peptidoglycan-associated protein
MKIRSWGVGLGAAAALALLPSCATKKYVSGEVERSSAASEKHIAEVESQIEQTQSKVGQHEQRIAELDKTTQDALDRANQAGKLARFPFNKHELSADAKNELDQFVDKLKSDDKNVYLEIQGHTDSTGSPDYNARLGEERAEAVRLYLNQKGVALNRMATISYGETQPVDSNKTREGRAKNRRVVIIVLS